MITFGNNKSELDNESDMTGVFKVSFSIVESKVIGVFGTDQSAEAVIKSFRSYVLGDKQDTIWLSGVTFNPHLAEIS